MRTPVEIRELADLRLAEAEALLVAGFPEGAFYLGGYCAEPYLKARICETIGIDEWFLTPTSSSVKAELVKPFKIHRPSDLLILAGVSRKLENAGMSDQDLKNACKQIMEWSEENRYAPKGSHPSTEVKNFLNAV